MKKIIAFTICSLFLFEAAAQKDNHSKYVIKYSPTQLVMGELHFAYEHRIMPQSSIEVTLGPTISEIGLPRLLFDNLTHGNAAPRESNIGFFGSLLFRYYPISGMATAPRGLYIAPEIKYRLYNSTYTDNFGTLGERTGATTQFMFKFHTGYQFWFGNKFSLDVFTAVGVGSASMTSYSAFDNYMNPTNDWNSYTKSRVSFVGSFGIKFGIGGTRKDI